MKNIIEKTNRTILFEEINPNKLNLLTILGDTNYNDTISDSVINEINKHLVVNSFDEFLEKFTPEVYSFLDVNTSSMKYTLQKPEQIDDSLITTILLDKENHFIKTIITLLESRKMQGIKNVEFKFENILNLLSPSKIINDIKQSRKEIEYLYNKFSELDEDNPKRDEYAYRLNSKFENISKYYNNTLSMLPLAIEDIKTRLMLDNTKKDVQIENIKAGLLQIGDTGKLEIIDSSNSSEKSLVISNNYNDSLAEVFRDDYNEVCYNKNSYIEDLVVRTFVPVRNYNNNINYEEEVNKYNSYLEFYKNSQESFIKISKPIIETIIGIKLFFDQYDVKNTKMKPSLLITNVQNSILTSANNIQKLDKYLLHVNGKNDLTNSIWFGIYPNISLEENSKNVRERFKTNKKNIISNNIEELSVLINVLAKYKIQTFINFELSEKMSFENLSINLIDMIEDKLSPLINREFSEYIIPVMPNFTIIPREQSGVHLDFKLSLNDKNISYINSDEKVKFFIDGIYVAGSYIASGLVSAYQCSNYLKERFKRVLNDEPAVRFNIESEDNYLKVLTTLPREISGYTIEFKDKINSNNFGFIFSSDILQLDGNKITNISVYKARCLLKDKDGYYEPIFKTTASTYIERVIRYMTSDFKLDKINFFFSNSPNSQKTIWLKEDDYINSIISKGDSIDHNIDLENNRFNLKLKFSGNEKNLIFNMNKNE